MSVQTASESGCDVAAEHTGAMIALFPSLSVARRLIVPGGEPVDQLHVTLIYLGKASDFNDSQLMMIRAALYQVTSQWINGYLVGKVGGVTIFPEGSDGVPFCAHVDVPNLTKLREQLVEILGSVHINSPSDHGFTPHMTLKYLKTEGRKPPIPPSIPLIFSNVSLVLGDIRSDYPLDASSTPSQHLMARRVMQHPMNGQFASIGR